MHESICKAQGNATRAVADDVCVISSANDKSSCAQAGRDDVGGNHEDEGIWGVQRFGVCRLCFGEDAQPQRKELRQHRVIGYRSQHPDGVCRIYCIIPGENQEIGMNTKIVRLSAFNYFGGKTRHLDWILPKLDRRHVVELRDCTHWVEVFCGSAVVSLNLDHPFPIETINDIDGGVVNFFRVLRDHGQELIDKVLLTPYSRNEYLLSLKPLRGTGKAVMIENARRYFVRQQQSFGGLGHARVNNWRTQYKETRRGMSLETSKLLGKIHRLDMITARLMMMQIENRDFVFMMENYAQSNTLLYCDPPYVHISRTGKKDYAWEMSDEQHERFLDLAVKSKSKIAISGYLNPLYNERLKDWYRYVCDERVVNIGRKRGVREVLWTNYNATNNLQLLF